MMFPKGVTNEERALDWQKIAEITDDDFGFRRAKKERAESRFTVRILLRNMEGKLCVIKSMKYGYIQLPGGGIESSESIVDGLRRETKEETGYLIDDIKPVGYTVERREGEQNIHKWGRNVAFAFVATATDEVGTEYTDDENAEEFAPVWMELDEIIGVLDGFEGRIESYSGCFSNRRDLLIAKYYKDNS